MNKIVPLLLIAVLLFAGCESDNSTRASIDKKNGAENSAEGPAEGQSLLEYLENKDTLTYKEYEFYVNYTLLKYYYVNASEELGDAEEYYYLESKLSTNYGNVYEMYNKMTDYYTFYYPPEYLDAVYSYYVEPSSEYSLGFEVDDNLVVTQSYWNGPAENAGIWRGDTLKTVDDIGIAKKETFERLTSGNEGDKINLGLVRGDSSFQVTIALQKVVLPTVFVDSVQNVPLIRVTSFESEAADGSTTNEFKRALKETDGAKATIIDLRNNHGGDISECLGVSELLLHGGDTIVIIDETGPNANADGQGHYREVIVADGEGDGVGRYYVFLSDSNSASCAETFMVAITTNKKSPIIGQQTYGKGIGQKYLVGEVVLGVSVITNLMFYDKNEVGYHLKGLQPDYETTNEEEAYAKALEFIEVEQQREAGYGSVDKDRYLKKSHGEKRLERGGAYRVVNIDTIPAFKNLKK